jgi:HAD superfamily hydrolase (TIGR01509 family)
MTADSEFILPKAVLFDMDGTLTEPMLDFPRIKREMGIEGRPILEALAELSGPAREVAEAVLLRHEEQAAAHSTLNSGCREVLDWLAGRSIPTALITRNSLTSVRTVIQRHGLPIEILITREDGRFKPDPHPLRLACGKLNVAESDAWMVGDGQYDVEAGAAAGVKTVWVSHNGPKSFAADPWRTVPDLFALLNLLGRCVA